MKEILKYLSQTYWKLNKAAMNYILENCDERLIPEGGKLLEEGQVCEHVWFIKKGLLRAFQESPAGKTFTNWFMGPNDIATSVISHFTGKASEEEIIAEEDSIVFEMPKTALFAGIEEHHCMAILTLMIVIRYYCDTRFNETYLRMKEPQLIHQRMLAECPQLLQLALGRDLASYLGVSEPSYRKIKGGKYKQPKAVENALQKAAAKAPQKTAVKAPKKPAGKTLFKQVTRNK